MKKIKTYLTNFLLILFSLLFSLVIIEVGLRFILFYDNSTIFDNMRNADNYASYFSDDDYYKLVYIFGNKVPQPSHPLLGWTGKFSTDSYLHNDYKSIGGRRAVLLYGDSFAKCTVPVCFEDILNADKQFSKEYYLLNYGVGGYGTDQIYLLLQNSIQLYDNPLVIVGIMTLDLDRSILSIRTNQKPYFQIENDQLVFKNSNIIAPNPDEYFNTHPPEITSYVYRKILYSYLPDKTISFLRQGHNRIAEKKAVNEKIILGIAKELQDNNLDFLFLIFHPHWDGVSRLDNEDDWRDPFLKELLTKNDLPYIWSKELFRQDIKNKQFSFDDYIIPDNGHPTLYFNKIIATEIKKRMLDLSSD